MTTELEAKKIHLDNELHRIETELASMKSQLDHAKTETAATGCYADNDWFNRLRTRIKYVGRDHQSLQRQLGEVSRQLRASSDAKRNSEQTAKFVQCAKEMLPPETVDKIWSAVRQC